ncbi:MAG: hypothetical protein LBP75_02315 [Planctomycetota bacterium]|jgi:hypothetical protein|nr:hypothetical protein [Planctomycetota bacterium]
MSDTAPQLPHLPLAVLSREFSAATRRTLAQNGITDYDADTVAQLRQAGNFDDAVLAQAALLPPMPALYWAWLCVNRYLRKTLTPAGLAAQDAMKEWLAACAECGKEWLATGNVGDAAKLKVEQAGIAAWQAAEADGGNSAAGVLCRGAYWFGDNVVPPEMEEVKDKIPPAPELPYFMAAAAARLCVAADPEQSAAILGDCLDTAQIVLADPTVGAIIHRLAEQKMHRIG